MVDWEGSVTKQLFDDYPDSIRHPLIVESADWEKLTAALTEVGQVTDALLPSSNRKEFAIFRTLRVLAEIAYTMGYQRGRKTQDIELRVTEE